MTETALLARPAPGSGPAEVDETVEDGGCLLGGFDLEPDGLGQRHQAELKETAARLLAPGKVDSGENPFAAVAEPEPDRPAASLDVDHLGGEELSPLFDPGIGVIIAQLAGGRDPGHVARLPTDGRSSPQRRVPGRPALDGPRSGSPTDRGRSRPSSASAHLVPRSSTASRAGGMPHRTTFEPAGAVAGLVSRWRDRMGAPDTAMVTAFVVVFTLALVVMAGLVLDGGLALAAKVQAIDTAQAAARAGAQAIDIPLYRSTGQITLDPAQAATDAEQYLAQSGHTGTVAVDGDQVTVTVTIRQPTQILSLVGIANLTETASGSATAEQANP